MCITDRSTTHSRPFCPSCSACRRTADIPGMAWRREACLPPHYFSHITKIFKVIKGTPTLTRGKSRADLGDDFVFSLPLMVINYQAYGKDHSNSERGNLLPPLHGLLFPISRKGYFICTIPQNKDSTHHGLCYTSRGTLAGTKMSSMSLL